MPRNGKSFYVVNEGPQDTSIKLGLQWLVQTCKNRDVEGLLAVGNLEKLQNMKWSEGSAIFQQLGASSECRLSGVTIKLMTLRTKGLYQWDGPILALFGGQKLLDAV